MTYRRRRALGEDAVEPAAPVAIVRGRGYVAVPAADIREYVKQSFLVAAIGFGFGVTFGAVLGKKL